VQECAVIAVRRRARQGANPEIQAAGWQGSVQAVRRYVRPFRQMTVAPPPAAVPKARQITSWLLRHPDSLDADERAALAGIRARCQHVDSLAVHVNAFAEMMTGRQGQHLVEDWLTRVEADDQPDLRSFATGIRQDYQAVLNGLTLPYSSGMVEGNVNKIKAIKRQMYGRAKPDLLRKRVLLASWPADHRHQGSHYGFTKCVPEPDSMADPECEAASKAGPKAFVSPRRVRSAVLLGWSPAVAVGQAVSDPGHVVLDPFGGRGGRGRVVAEGLPGDVDALALVAVERLADRGVVDA
jgi:hypothetical protein